MSLIRDIDFCAQTRHRLRRAGKGGPAPRPADSPRSIFEPKKQGAALLLKGGPNEPKR